MMNNPQQTREVADYYTDYSTWYEAERREGYYSLINDLEFEKIEPSLPGATALEVGCGTGLILERADQVAKRAIGIDLSIGMATVSHGKGLTVANAVVGSLPFPDSTFDVVYSFKVLPHVADLQTGLAEINRVLKPNGRAFLEFYSPHSFKALAYRLRQLGKRTDPVFVKFHTVRDVERLLPDELRVRSIRGVRIFAPIKYAYTVPGLRQVFHWLERRFCESRLARFGGYLVLELDRSG